MKLRFAIPPSRGPAGAGRHRGRGGAVIALLLASALPPHGAAAEGDVYDQARAAHPELFHVYYDEGVMEYCGLQTRAAMGGFVTRRDVLLATPAMSEKEHRAVRIAAMTAVYLEYEDRGLSGQRNWCRTEGLDAYGRFIADYWYEQRRP